MKKKQELITAITPVMITLNEADNLPLTLDSLSGFERVVLYDTGSTDATVAVAQSFNNVEVHSGFFDGFGSTKQRAVDLSPTDWVFLIDADERPDISLLEALFDFDIADHSALGVVTRRNYFCGELVRHSGWGGDQLLRVFHRKNASLNRRLVHEAVEGVGARVFLGGYLDHFSINSIGELLRKFDQYSLLKNQQVNQRPSALFVVAKFIVRFLHTYFFRLGFLDGRHGLVIAFANASFVVWCFARQLEINQDFPDQRASESLSPSSEESSQ